MSQAPSPAQRYLRRIFSLNPVFQADEIVRLRSESLKQPRLDKATNKNRSAVCNREQAKQTALRQIAYVQSEFWKLPIEMLQQHIAQIDTKEVPELSPVVQRLKTAATCRSQFPVLAQQPWMDLTLFRAFKSAAVLPPAQAALERETYLSRIDSRKSLKQIQAIVSKIEKEYPVLYSLERDWFETIKKHRVLTNHHVSSLPTVANDSFGFDDLIERSWIFLPLLIFLIRVLLRLMMHRGGQ